MLWLSEHAEFLVDFSQLTPSSDAKFHHVMFDLRRDHPQIKIQVQSLNEKPAKGSQHGVVCCCCHHHTCNVVSKVGNGLIYQEEQVQAEQGDKEVHQELS